MMERDKRYSQAIKIPKLYQKNDFIQSPVNTVHINGVRLEYAIMSPKICGVPNTPNKCKVKFRPL
ncbi:hypothetical protein ACTXT7_005342 [Hymenolepis weldensis]